MTPELSALKGTHAEALSINAAGKVAGFGLPAGASGQNAFFETVGTSVLNIGTLGGTDSVAQDINNNDLLAGSSYLVGDTALHAFVSQSGGAPQDLGVFPGGSSSRALAINDAGQVVGAGTTAALTEHGFLWQPGGALKDIGTLGGANSVANDINGTGQVTGYSELAGSKAQHAFLYQAGILTDLKTLGGSFSEGNAINASGVVVGHSTLLGDTAEHAFVAKPGAAMADIGTLGGTSSEAYAVNTAGDVVGSSTTRTDAALHAFIWKNGALTDLNALVLAGSPWTLIAARSIGDNGDIVGYGDYTDPVTLTVQRRAFLLTRDRVAPTITCPANVTTSGAQPASLGTATATDNLDPTPVIASNAPVLPATFPNGVTNVTWTATDSAGNVASCNQLVNIAVDTTPPVISANWTPVVPDGLAGWYKTKPSLLWSVVDKESAISLTTGCVNTAITADTASTGITLDCSAKSAGGLASSSTTVMVDSTSPTLVAHTAVNGTLNGAPTMTVTYTSPAASDALPGSGLDLVGVDCKPASGGSFGLGTTPVTCTASDKAGNTGTSSFDVVVVDASAPSITPVITGTAGTNGWYRSGVTLAWTVSDLESPTTVKPAGCSGLNLLADTVAAGVVDSCGATSAGGIAATQSQTIRIDTVAPVVAVNPDITVEAIGPRGATVSWNGPTATDALSGPATQTAVCSPASGTIFGLVPTPTPVTCKATDLAGNTSSSSFNVTVQDTTGPVLTLPANISVAATDVNGTVVTYTASARDAVSLTTAITCTPASGSTFPAGTTTTVSCSSSDALRNTTNGSFTVTVGKAPTSGTGGAGGATGTPPPDTIAPVITVPGPITVTAATGASSAVVTYTATSDDGSLVTCNPASGFAFPLGTTTVSCSATDAALNTGTASFTVTVNPAPVVTGAPDLATTVAVSTTTPRVGDRVTYTFVVRNAGNADAAGVVFTDVLPAALKFDKVSTTAGTCSNTNGTVRCNLGTRVVGSSTTITIAVKPSAAGSFGNSGNASTTTAETVTANNDSGVVTITAR